MRKSDKNDCPELSVAEAGTIIPGGRLAKAEKINDDVGW